jgi:hypothetical protein
MRSYAALSGGGNPCLKTTSLRSKGRKDSSNENGFVAIALALLGRVVADMGQQDYQSPLADRARRGDDSALSQMQQSGGLQGFQSLLRDPDCWEGPCRLLLAKLGDREALQKQTTPSMAASWNVGIQAAARACQTSRLGSRNADPLRATAASSTQVGAKWRANFLHASADAAMISADSRGGAQFEEGKRSTSLCVAEL